MLEECRKGWGKVCALMASPTIRGNQQIISNVMNREPQTQKLGSK
jgi:hypothetical protein